MNSGSISRRGWVRIISYLSALFLVLVGLLICKMQERSRLQQSLALTQLHAFHELSDAVGELDLMLEKASYAASPSMISNLCTEIHGKAEVAQLSLGELPYANVELEQTAAFVARVGDYAYAISRSTTRDGGWTEEEQTTWAALSAQAGTLSQQLADLECQVQNGQLTLESVQEAESRMDTLSESDSPTQDTPYQEVEESYEELPTLIYDGPFSQHLDSRSPAALAGQADITQQEAVGAAEEFLGGAVTLSVTSRLEGTIPGWLLSGQLGEEQVTVEISQAGGQVIQFSQAHLPVSQQLTQEQGVEQAKAWLTQRGYDSMNETYYQESNRILTVNFAYQQGDVVCYPDLVKVEVALDTGNIIGFEAKGYLTCHRSRDLSDFQLTQEEAEALVPSWVEVQSSSPALIPTSGGYETLCWEVLAQGDDGRQVLYYLNAETGGEEQIFLLEISPSGTLAV